MQVRLVILSILWIWIGCTSNIILKVSENVISPSIWLDGFSIAFNDVKQVQSIERMGLEYIADIVQDRYLYATSLIYGNEVWKNAHVTQFPKDFMDIPNPYEYEMEGGKHVNVAVLDQGIRHTDPAFIVADLIEHEKKVSRDSRYVLTEPTYEPHIDVYGNHGISMASLIGGTMPFAPGIAPHISFYDYRILDERHRTSHARTLAAIRFAIEDGVDLINLSIGGFLGGNFQIHGPFLNYRATHLTSEILVSASIGNYGRNQLLFQVNDLANSDSIIGVASFRNPVHKVYQLQLQWYQEGQGAHEVIISVSDITKEESLDPYLRTSQTFFPYDEQTFLNPLRRNEFHHRFPYPFFLFAACGPPLQCLELAQRLQQDEKVLGIIFISEHYLLRYVFEEIKKPLYQVQGVIAALQESLPNLYYAFGNIVVDYVMFLDSPPRPSLISSLGPSYTLSIKPDISLIGCNIRQYLGNEEGYIIGQGSSNSNGILTGIFGLLVDYAAVLDVPIHLNQIFIGMQNTAKPSFISKLEVERHPHLRGLAHSVLLQGPGIIQVRAMLKTRIKIQPSKIEHGSHFPTSSTNELKLISHLEIVNAGDVDVQVFVQHSPATSMHYSYEKNKYVTHNYRLEVDFWHSHPSLSTARFLILPKRSIMHFPVVFYLYPTGIPNFLFFSGYLQFFPIDPTKSTPNHVVFMKQPEFPKLSVPYLLMYGDMNEYPIFNTVGERASFLTNSKIIEANANLNEETTLADINPPYPFPIYEQDLTAEFTFQPMDQPVINLCPSVPLRQLSFYLLTYELNQRIGWIRTYKNVPQKCFSFLIHDTLFFRPGEVIPTYLLEYQGWNGNYVPNSNRNEIQVVLNGYYRICVIAILQMNFEQTSSNYHWCSVGFKVNRVN